METPGQDEIEELRRWLLTQGATEEQVQNDACGGLELNRLASDVVLHRDDELSARAIASRIGVDPERVVDLFRAYGVAVSDTDEAQFSEADVELVTVAIEAGMIDSPDGRVLGRVVANALDRVAEAAVAFYVQGTEEQLIRDRVSPLEWAQKTVYVTELAGRLGDGMGLLFRHHLRQAIGRQRVSQLKVTSRDVAWMAVGFVDLVDSTAHGQTLEMSELRKLVGEFEAQAFDVAARHGGRLVKFIGDEIMVAALDPVSGCQLMLALMEACSTEGMRPRGGLAWGEVLFRSGDYYGREVNLASRLVDAAIPGEVLVDGAVVDGAVGLNDSDTVAFEPAGRRVLKGFADPVAVWSVTANPED